MEVLQSGAHRTQTELLRALSGVRTVEKAWLRPVSPEGAIVLFGGRGVREHSETQDGDHQFLNGSNMNRLGERTEET